MKNTSSYKPWTIWFSKETSISNKDTTWVCTDKAHMLHDEYVNMTLA